MKIKRDNKTKIPDIKAHIKDNIKNQKLKTGFRLPSTVKYAQSLKADKMTVNKALTELETEGIVYRVKGSGTFVADLSKPSLAKKGSIKIGVLMKATIQPQITNNSYWYGIIQGILNQFELENDNVTFSNSNKKGFTSAVWNSPKNNVTVECIGAPFDSISNLPNFKSIDHESFDGYIIIGMIDEKWIRNILDLKKPVTLVDYHEDRYHNECDMVTFDSAPAYKDAIAYLAKKNLKRIIFLGDRHGASNIDSNLSPTQIQKIKKQSFFLDPDTLVRLYAYLLAMPKNGLCVDESWIQFDHNSTDKFRERALKHCKLPKNERPQAVICSYSELAGAYVNAFKDKGLPMMGVGVVNVNPNEPYVQSKETNVLNIQSYPKTVGQKAAYLLAKRISKPRSQFSHISIPMKFIPNS